MPFCFLLTNPPPLSVQTLSWKMNKELQELWTNKTLQERLVYCTYLLFDSLLFSIFSAGGHIERNTPLNPLSALPTVVYIVANPLPPPRCGHPLWMLPIEYILNQYGIFIFVFKMLLFHLWAGSNIFVSNFLAALDLSCFSSCYQMAKLYYTLVSHFTISQ